MELDVSKLKEQIAKEKESLKSVDENIKKITGRDPNEARATRERPGNDTRRVSVGVSIRGRDHASSFRRPRSVDSRDAGNDSEPPRKRAAVFSRLGASVGGRRVAVSRTKITEKEDEDYDEEDVDVKPAVQSSVVSTAKKITKDDLISAQNVGEKGRARNRRMFGMLLGTLAKFNADGQGRQSKQTLKQKEVETRLEEETEQERKKLASERKILFTERRQQQRRISLMEEKIALANELLEWEKEWEKKSHFIMTKASPSIFFLPNEFTPRTQRALQDSKDRIKGLVEKHRTSVAETMSAYDDEIKILENKQDNDNGKGVKNGEGMHASKVPKKGGKIDNEPEEEMDLDSMEHHVDIKVDVEDAEQNAGQVEEETNEPVQSQPVDGEVEEIKMEEPEHQPTAEKPVTEANGKCSGSVESSPVHKKGAESGEDDNQKTENASSPSNDVAETEQTAESTVSIIMPKQEPTATEECEEASADGVVMESNSNKDEKCRGSEQSEEESHSSASDDTSSESDDKESDKDNKTDMIKVANPSTVHDSVVVLRNVSGDESKVAGEQQVTEPDKDSLATDVTKKEITKTADVSSRDSKPSGSRSRRRRDSSSSSDSTSSSSSSSDNTTRKARRRSGDGGSRRRDSRDNYRSRRYHRDRSRSRNRRDRSRSRDHGNKRDHRRR